MSIISKTVSQLSLLQFTHGHFCRFVCFQFSLRRILDSQKYGYLTNWFWIPGTQQINNSCKTKQSYFISVSMVVVIKTIDLNLKLIKRYNLKRITPMPIHAGYNDLLLYSIFQFWYDKNSTISNSRKFTLSIHPL